MSTRPTFVQSHSLRRRFRRSRCVPRLLSAEPLARGLGGFQAGVHSVPSIKGELRLPRFTFSATNRLEHFPDQFRNRIVHDIWSLRLLRAEELGRLVKQGRARGVQSHRRHQVLRRIARQSLMDGSEMDASLLGPARQRQAVSGDPNNMRVRIRATGGFHPPFRGFVERRDA